MGFDTLSFWFAFLVLVGLYHCLRSLKSKNALLLISSYGLYCSFDPRFLPILLASTITDFLAGFWLGPNNSSLKRRWAIFASLSVNLGLLFTFKYLLDVFTLLGWQSQDHFFLFKSLGEYGLPLGISFYTFQTLSYSFDVYRGKLKHTNSLLNFALYVSFFPQLMAGPIEKARRLLPQVTERTRASLQDFREGTLLILLGLFKKIYVANSLGVAVEHVFRQSDSLPSLYLLASLLMTFQVYADFSGYSDMARGMARFFGIRIMINFKPFFASYRPQLFWQCWHISFTEWIRDYVILPFRDPKKREWHLCMQILITFVLIGLWHKASWNWILFGLLHAFVFILNRQWSRATRHFGITVSPWIGVPIGLLVMYTVFILSGLLHRSEDPDMILNIGQSILKFSGWGEASTLYMQYALQFLGPLIIYEAWTLYKKDEFILLKNHWVFQAVAAAFVLTALTIWERSTGPGFIYFAF